MNVITGFGYLTDSNGNITDKYVLPIGEHPLAEGFTQIEVADQGALDAIEIYVAPVSEEDQSAQDQEALIQGKMRELAIAALQDEGAIDDTGAITHSGKAAVASIRLQKTATIQ